MTDSPLAQRGSPVPTPRSDAPPESPAGPHRPRTPPPAPPPGAPLLPPPVPDGEAPDDAPGLPGPPVLPDLPACEYASPELARVWHPRTQVVLERRLWLAVLRAQHAEGLRVPAGVLADYARVVDRVDLDAIRRREHGTRHDLKARIEEFNALAGHEHIHKGLTSCDITDNIAQTRVRMSLDHLRARARRLADRTDDAARARALHTAAARLDALLGRYPLRGIKGPVGTAQDMLDLLGGDHEALARVEQHVAAHLGFARVLTGVGQLYPRTLDHDVAGTLGEFARLAARGAADTEVPRLRALGVLLRGYAAMAAQLAGEQWNEGDVSCSVVRRIALPGACCAADAVLGVLDGPSADGEVPRP
ncbi:adenylosuccinate lyase [Streptomyces sp. NRRL F-5053]|uniref:adenylosuccinate lyase n=1 Tax=Streptomyces sp. NRRL F-5053 TaxID=1463854 RepID=UPI000AC00E87|nr:adenylosuccinate lyase [Streptomyces sp. NRRL F-5053]